MTDFLLELRSEEIPARMQVKAKDDLARLFAEEIAKSGLVAERIETFATPRRLALVAHGLPAETAAVSEERKGPRANAPEQALAGFLRSTGLTRDRLVERDGVFFAVIDKPGRPTADVLAEAIPAVIRAFPWPKSMRWGTASASTESLRWVRPLQGIVAILGDDVVPFDFDGLTSGAATLGHRFHHPGVITIGGAHDYVEKLRACHVIVHLSERTAIIRDGAQKLAADAGLTLVEDEGLVVENAGLTEWPVPLLGSFDPAFLDVPQEVIQLTARVNQKYFVLRPANTAALSTSKGDPDGPGFDKLTPTETLAPNFVCTANIDASDGGKAIVAGNERVLSARLSDAKFFWDNDLKVDLETQSKKLGDIVFHEKLGTVADKVERVAKLARWLVESGVVTSDLPERSRGTTPSEVEVPVRGSDVLDFARTSPSTSLGEAELATLAERAARLCKADLVTGMVGEFPELQGIIGGHLARAQGEPDAVADAIRDHYKPVGQGDEVPAAPVTVAVSLADKIDSLVGFFGMGQKPTGSKDPFALRRAALGCIYLITANEIRLPLESIIAQSIITYLNWIGLEAKSLISEGEERLKLVRKLSTLAKRVPAEASAHVAFDGSLLEEVGQPAAAAFVEGLGENGAIDGIVDGALEFLADRLKVQQREAGVRHDLIDAVFALGGEDDLVRLLARVKALQAFVTTADGANLLAGYKRAANILKKSPSPLAGEGGAPSGAEGEGPAASAAERLAPAASGVVSSAADAAGPSPGADAPPSPARGEGLELPLSYTPEISEAALIAALDSAEPRAAAAIAAEDFEGAMTALAALRAPIDAFFETVTINDPDTDKRSARLALLLRVKNAVHRVADFSKIEG